MISPEVTMNLLINILKKIPTSDELMKLFLKDKEFNNFVEKYLSLD